MILETVAGGERVRQGVRQSDPQRAPARGDKWRMDQVVISIAGEPHWLWRAVDQNGIVLDVLVQRRRDARAAQRLHREATEIRRHTATRHDHGQAPLLGAARAKMGLQVEHRQHKGLNNRAENSGRQPRRRQTIMKRFKSARQAQRFLTVHDQVANLFPHPLSRESVPLLTSAALRASEPLRSGARLPRLPSLPNSRLSETRLLQLSARLT